MITVTLYTRKECHLCDVAKDDLISLREEIPHKLVEVDIDGNRDLQVAYGFDIPVGFIFSRCIVHRFTGRDDDNTDDD